MAARSGRLSTSRFVPSTFVLMGQRFLPANVQELQFARRGNKLGATRHLRFETVGIKLHLSHHETADAVSEMHEKPKNASRQPNGAAREIQDKTDAKIPAAR